MPRASSLLVVSCLAALALLVGLPSPWIGRAPLATPSPPSVVADAASTRAGVAAASELPRALDAASAGAGQALARPRHVSPLTVGAALDASLRDDVRVCKPAGPWGAQLLSRGLADDGSVLLDVVLKPRLAHAGLHWSLWLPPGTRVLAGRLSGDVFGEPGEEHRESLTVALPAGLDAGSVRLDVTPLDDARLASSREVDFGAPPEVGRPQRFVADNGAATALAVLPSVTREGR